MTEVKRSDRVTVSCPHCGQRLSVRRDKLSSVTCASCAHVFSFPMKQPTPAILDIPDVSDIPSVPGIPSMPNVSGFFRTNPFWYGILTMFTGAVAVIVSPVFNWIDIGFMGKGGPWWVSLIGAFAGFIAFQRWKYRGQGPSLWGKVVYAASVGLVGYIGYALRLIPRVEFIGSGVYLAVAGACLCALGQFCVVHAKQLLATGPDGRSRSLSEALGAIFRGKP